MWQLEPHKDPYAKKINRRLFPREIAVKAQDNTEAETITRALGSLWWRRYTLVYLDDSYNSLKVIRELRHYQRSREYHWDWLDFVCVGKGVRPRNGISMRYYIRVQCDPWVWIRNSVDEIITLPDWVQHSERELKYAV